MMQQWCLGSGTFDIPPNPDRTLYAEVHGGGAYVVIYARDRIPEGARRVVARTTTEEAAQAACRLLSGGLAHDR
jgi:hypothetical protein